MQSCIWQRKQLWQHYNSAQKCLRSRVNWPSLMHSAARFISSLTKHQHTPTRTQRLTHFHGFRSSSSDAAQKRWSFLCFLTQWMPHVLSQTSDFQELPVNFWRDVSSVWQEVPWTCPINFLQNQQVHQETVNCQGTGKPRVKESFPSEVELKAALINNQKNFIQLNKVIICPSQSVSVMFFFSPGNNKRKDVYESLN